MKIQNNATSNMFLIFIYNSLMQNMALLRTATEDGILVNYVKILIGTCVTMRSVKQTIQRETSPQVLHVHSHDFGLDWSYLA
jgi:hypothetical protein